MISRSDIGRDEIFDFHIYHNNNHQQQKSSVGKCEGDNKHAFSIERHADRDRSTTRLPTNNNPKPTSSLSMNENLLIQIFDNQSSDVDSYRSRSIFAFFRADQDKRDDTKFYSLFSTISTRAIPGCVCGGMKRSQGVSKLIAKSYRSQQQRQSRKS